MSPWILKLEHPPPLPVTWEMKDVSTARTSLERLPGGRLEMRVEHEPLAGVTPAMLVWWYRTFPFSRLQWEGDIVSLYRVWHPRDHVRFSVLRRSRRGGAGASERAVVLIYEQLGKRTLRAVARVRSMDESGVRFTVKRFWLVFADLMHEFEAVPEGTLVRSRLVVGTKAPLVRLPLNAVLRRFRFDEEDAREWIRHDVEEIGNLQFFLPRIYTEAQRL
jgi:DAPG hydrolase PhiG domain